MADSITFSSNINAVLKGFAKQPAKIQDAIVRGTKRGLLLTRGYVRKGAELRFTGGRSGLISRLTSDAHKTGLMGMTGYIGFRRTTGFPYELSQEFGAHAKPGKMMAIPVSPLAIAAGQRGIGPRKLGVKLFIPPHMHVLCEAYKSQKRGPIKTVHYVLVESIKPRLNFRRTVLDQAPMIGREIAEEYNKAGGQ
jgi:hypothetical protein